MLPNNTYLTKYLFGLFIILIMLYGGFEMRNYINGPDIMIVLPPSGTVVRSATININGTVNNVTSLVLGGDSVVVDQNGSFSKELLLAPGVNTFVFIAKDKFGKQHEKHFNVIYKPRKKKSAKATTTATTSQL